ncbi:gliding motility protein GldC [bacterium]|nr:gliding motility protein GldC [bacterium]
MKAEIKLEVQLDENRVAESIRWTAAEGGVDRADAGAILLSVWDPAQKDTLRIDLWTKEMPLDDMKRFVHQTLMSLADTLDRSTSEEAPGKVLRAFARDWAVELGIAVPPLR